MKEFNPDAKTVCEHDILMHVKVIGYSTVPIISKDFVRKFTPDICKRPRIFLDSCLNGKTDPNYSKWNIFRSGGEISQKDFKAFISLPNVKMRKGTAPKGNTYEEYYIDEPK